MQTGARSARQLVREATGRLIRADVPEPAASAEVLLSELLGVRRSELALREEPLTDEEAALYDAWIRRRTEREPVQRILGYAYFRNLELELDASTLIPRPDTESVVDAALKAIDRRGARPGVPCRVLDVGTGTGAIAVSIAQERPFCEVHATDSSGEALAVARRNAEKAGVPVRFHEADLFAGLEVLASSVDLLVSNPPYISSAEIEGLAPEVRDWELRAALDGGPDGLDFYRRIFTGAAPVLKDGADVLLEVGDGQAEDVLALGHCVGYKPLGVQPDLAGTPRAVLLRWGLL